MGPVLTAAVNRNGLFQGKSAPVLPPSYKKQKGPALLTSPVPFHEQPPPQNPNGSSYFVLRKTLVRSHPFARCALGDRNLIRVHLSGEFLPAGDRISVAAGRSQVEPLMGRNPVRIDIAAVGVGQAQLIKNVPCHIGLADCCHFEFEKPRHLSVSRQFRGLIGRFVPTGISPTRDA
jgi:hypothetical protein